MTTPHISHLSVRFPDRAGAILDIGDLDLTFEAPTIVVGPSGSGKTTFFRAISGWYNGSDVRVTLNCNFSAVHDVEFIGNHSSMLPWMRVSDNLNLSGGAQVDLQADLHFLELPADVVSLWPYQLSLGMYKRVELVRALHLQPKLLILDEFFASLDAKSASLCASYVSRFFEKCAVVVSTHQLDTMPFKDYKLIRFDRDQNGTSPAVLSW